MHRYRHRLDERAEFEIEVVGQRVERVGGNRHVLRQTTRCECTEKHVLWAEVIAPGAAESALLAAPDRLDHNALALLESAYFLADFRDFTGELVSRRNIGVRREDTVVEMQIGAADAAGSHPD